MRNVFCKRIRTCQNAFRAAFAKKKNHLDLYAVPIIGRTVLCAKYYGTHVEVVTLSKPTASVLVN